MRQTQGTNVFQKGSDASSSALNYSVSNQKHLAGKFNSMSDNKMIQTSSGAFQFQNERHIFTDLKNEDEINYVGYQ